MSARRYENGVLREQWDDANRTYTSFDETGTQSEQRPFTAEENTRATADAAESQRVASRATLTDEQQLSARLSRLSAYKTDAEIVAALARTNTTAPTTQELNRLLKVMLRRDERQSAAIALLTRLVNPALLTDTSDTTDS